MKSYATLDTIVRSAMADANCTSEHYYQPFLRHALKCYQDFMMDASGEVITRTFTMNDLKQIDLPADFVDWSKVGFQCGDKIKILGTKENISNLHPKDGCGNPLPFNGCGCSVNELPNNFSSYGGYYFFNPVNDYGELLGGLYGYGGGYDKQGYFKVLKEQNVIQFSSEVNNTTIYMEYISTGFNPSQQTIVHQYAKEMIVEYIHWKRFWFAGDPRWAEAKANYYVEEHKVRLRLMDFSIRDILESSRNSQTQAIKQ